MKYFTPTQLLLHKAGKAGLVPLKKQVTKNGKTYMQTFWVKPGDVPGKEKPKKTEETPKAKPQTQDWTDVPVPSNMEGGFHVQYFIDGEPSSYKLPERAIHKAFTFNGFTWVIHNKIAEGVSFSNELVISEATTGKSAYGMNTGDTDDKTLMAGFKEMVDRLIEMDPDRIKSVIGKNDTIEKIPKSGKDTGNFEMERKATEQDKKNLVAHIKENVLDDEDFPEAHVAEWVDDQFSGVNAHLLNPDNFDNSYDDSYQVEFAILYKKSILMADQGIENINNAVYEINNSGYYNPITEPDFHSYLEYLIEHGIEPEDLADYDYDLSHMEGGYAWSQGDVLAGAWDNGSDPQSYKNDIEQQLEEETKANVEDVSFESNYGITWEYSDLANIGSWVTGSVRGNREEVKGQDEERRKGVEVELYGGLARTIEDNARVYDEGPLYRGTSNPDWGDVEPGQVKTLGMASFSKNEQRAKGFADAEGWTLIIQHSVESPLYGVDVDEIIDSGGEAGFHEELTALNVSEYAEEQEVIVRSPSIRVLSKNTSDRTILVEAAEMDLLDLMKSLFEMDEALERSLDNSFNFRLHDPAEKMGRKKK